MTKPRIVVYQVTLIESERGWGQKVDGYRYFKNREKADDYCKEFNAYNTADTAPDWYMVAHGPDEIIVDEGEVKLLDE